ncbi:MAG: cupin domain-containing protein [Candidatus Hydrogenedentes bacterium]|nr:cupin domain-containing protein [Candidatus Hydrogenedentota bacterium]
MSEYALTNDVRNAITYQSESIVSKTVFAGEHAKVVVMALDAGQELSEHTAAMPAAIHVLEGEAEVTLGSDLHRLKAGAWVHMDANLRHAVRAIAPTTLLLTLFKKGTIA